jgi:hypothetical protein
MHTLRKLGLCVSLCAMLGIIGNSGTASATRVPHLPYQVQTVTKANLQWYIEIAPVVGPRQPHALTQWNTINTDVTATWPDATDPTWKLPVSAQIQLACVRWHESRNHLTSVETHSQAGGWYQFTPYIWSYAREHIPGLPATPQAASGDQQSTVAVWYYQRNHGLYPEWAADMASCG